MLSAGLSVTADNTSSHCVCRKLERCEVQDGFIVATFFGENVDHSSNLSSYCDCFSDGPFPSTVVTCFLKFPVRIFLGPLATSKSTFSKSGIGSSSEGC